MPGRTTFAQAYWELGCEDPIAFLIQFIGLLLVAAVAVVTRRNAK
jgi:hypothetical protein